MKKSHYLILGGILSIVLVLILLSIFFLQNQQTPDNNEVSVDTPPRRPTVEATKESLTFSYPEESWQSEETFRNDVFLNETETKLTQDNAAFTISVVRSRDKKNGETPIGRQLVPMQYQDSDFEILTTIDSTNYLVSTTGVTAMRYSDDSPIPIVTASASAQLNMPYYVYQEYSSGISSYLTILSETDVISYVNKTQLYYTFTTENQEEQQEEWEKNKTILKEILESLDEE
jgi:hypothetical protein